MNTAFDPNTQSAPHYGQGAVPYGQTTPYGQPQPYGQLDPHGSPAQFQNMPAAVSAAPSSGHPAHVQYAPVAPSLGELRGLVVRQKTQKTEVVAQALGLPIESENKYRVSALPVGKAVKSRPDDPDGWAPTGEELAQLDALFFAREESDSCTRSILTWMGCRRLRPLQMHFSVAGATGDVYVLDRPFRLGGVCCSPLEMTVNSTSADGQPGAVHLGRVREDFSPYFSRCLTSCGLATTYTDIERALPDGSYETRYSLRTNLSCCGRVNNWCGATCLQNDAVYDILDTRGEIVAHLQMTYGGGGDDCLGAFCRMNFSFNNYVLEFPRDSTPEDRVLLLAALFQIEFQHFESAQEE